MGHTIQDVGYMKIVTHASNHVRWMKPVPTLPNDPALSLSNGRSAPNKSMIPNPRPLHPHYKGVVLKETLIGAKVKEIKGENKSVTKVNYFRGNDQEKWKSNISTYDVVDLGEVYKGIELKLKAYGNNVEKLFYVKPGANTNQIKIGLSGIQPPVSPFFKGDFKKI